MATGRAVPDNAAAFDAADLPDGGRADGGRADGGRADGGRADGGRADGEWADGALAAGEAPDGETEVLELLERGRLTVEGRLVDASNATLLCTIETAGEIAQCVYKPVAGERPLWDFPNGTLAGREVSAYLVSRAADWNFVPPTVLRDGPYGPGMCQLWIDLDESADLIALSRRTDHAALREMAVFDAVINNADRKIGHLLPVPDGHLYGCDHGICFAEEYKLRTVLWQWRGEELPARALQTLRRLAAGLADGWLTDDLAPHLTRAEIAATKTRIDLMLASRVHPFPSEDWPAVPWPPV
jgi:uncharacterized repeat protein (TIGR03843 family)